MGKKKQQQITSNPEGLKDAGNKAFIGKDYDKAIKLYTQAIDLTSLENPNNYIYFANRANAQLELGKFDQCITDCDESIKIEQNYAKTYIRKAKAQLGLKLPDQALETLELGMQVVTQNEDLKKHFDEISKFIENDKKLSKENPELQKFQNLLNWLDQSNDIQRDKIKMQYFRDGYRGVHSTCDINANETIISIPFDKLVTMDLVKNTPIGKQMSSKWLLAGKSLKYKYHNYMAAYLLQQKVKQEGDHEFGPYIDILPKNFSEFPTQLEDHELKYLEKCQILNLIIFWKEIMKNEYELICKHVPDFKSFTFDEYHKALLSSTSRCFGVQVEGEQQEFLVPLVDMCNHKTPKQARYSFNQEMQCFTVEALKEIQKGEEVFICYGDIELNSKIFLNYGFVCDSGMFDVEFKLSVNKSDTLKLLKESLFKDVFQYTQTFKIYSNLDQKLSKFENLIGFARWIVFDKNEDESDLLKAVLKFKKQNPSSVFKGHLQAVSKSNELAAWQLISETAQNYLKQYPTTIAEDSVILEKCQKGENVLSMNEKNCILFRKGEKDVFQFIMNCNEQIKQLSELSYKDAVRESRKMKNYSNIQPYIQNQFLGYLQ